VYRAKAGRSFKIRRFATVHFRIEIVPGAEWRRKRSYRRDDRAAIESKSFEPWRLYFFSSLTQSAGSGALDRAS